jgi:hypothetical protein
MVKKPSTPPAKRSGFSLVLALVMAAALVIVIIVLAAFLKVESRLAVNSVLLTRARLNTVASMRLAQGNLQQMLGPDTRITGNSALFDDPATTDTFDFPVLGVWRSWEGLDHETSNTNYLGRPLQRPDYNLKASDNSINSKGRFLGWLTSNTYAPLPAPATPVPGPPPLPPAVLFTPAKPTGGPFSGRFSSSPSLPQPKPLPPSDPATPRPIKPKPAKPPVAAAPNALPLWTNSGNLAALLTPALAYSSPLVGTNTVPGASTDTVIANARVTLTAQTFPDTSDGTFAWWVSGENQKALVTVEAPLPAISGSTTADVLEAARRTRTFGSVDFTALGLTQPTTELFLPSRASFDNAIKAGQTTVTTLDKTAFHDYTTYSPGLLVNAATGGFRRDLSLLAETWDWMNIVDAGRTVSLPFFRTKPKVISSANTADLLYGRPQLDGPAGTLGNKNRHALLYWWSEYSQIGSGTATYNDSGTYRGLAFIPPVRSWNTMVDYMLQYRKAVVAGTPDKVVEMRPSSGSGTTGGNNPMYNYHETVFRHPVVARMQFVFAMTATADGVGHYQRHIILQPVITFWNPYNVRLKVPDVSLEIKADQLPIGFSKPATLSQADSVIVPIGAWFSPGSWTAIKLNMNSPGGVMDLAPGETRVYSIIDSGQKIPSGPGGFLWNNGNTNIPYVASGVGQGVLNLKPGFISGYNGGSGIWLTWWEDNSPSGTQASRDITGFVMRKLNTGQDSIGINMWLGASLSWANFIPSRFSFGNDIWTDSAMWLFQSLYGPDDTNVPFGFPIDSVIGRSSPFGTFAFGLRMANDGTNLNNYTSGANVANSTSFQAGDPGIVSRGMLQASPFTCYTELGDKSAQVLVYNGQSQASSSTSATQNGIRYFGCMHPINAPFDLWWRPMAGWMDSNAPQSFNSQGYVVSGLEPATGLSTAVVAELPVTPLQSLADLQNWDVRGFNPAPPFIYGIIGNSDASPILPSDDVVGRWFMSNPPANTYKNRDQVPAAFLQHDDRYCLNHVLFDDWFVSSLAPDYSKWSQLNDDSKGLAAVTELKTAWSKVLDGTGPLANRAYKPALNAADLAMDSQGSVTWTSPNTGGNTNGGGPKIPDAWLKMGAYLTVNGQFNVNSTSVPAWRAVLGSLRDQKIPVVKASASSMDSARAPLVRMVPSPETISSTARSAALTGYNALTDAQLDTLAKEIVKQVQLRGPFLSLSEFVNRQLAPFDGNSTDPCLRGALQAALEVLQQDATTLAMKNVKPSSGYKLNAATYGKPTTPVTDLKLNPAGFSADYINPQAAVGNSSEGLPGWPRQADLLRRLAPIMSVRDETFLVRSLGEVNTPDGTSRAWCEAIYQRLPEYVDPRVEPWKAPMGDYIPNGGSYLESPTVKYPYMANAVFGRRVKLVSFRWLRADEL